MSRTARRGKDERSHVYDKKLGTGAFKQINKDRRSKQVKSKQINSKEKHNGYT